MLSLQSLYVFLKKTYLEACFLLMYGKKLLWFYK